MNCAVCNSGTSVRKKYDRHLADLSLKSVIKRSLPYVDFLTPSFIPKLKRYSSRGRLFRGHVRVCADCGYGVMEDPPTNAKLRSYYLEAYWSARSAEFDGAPIGADAYRSDPRANSQADFVRDWVHSRPISNCLEIGAGAACSSLLLRDRLKDSGINLYVCEPGQRWEKHYRAQGIRKIAEYFPFQTTERFDYVHTSHWLEHVLDLDETLSGLNSLIEPTGLLFVEVPNTEHNYWDLPLEDTPHIHFFTRRSLVRVFGRYHFDCLGIAECGISYLDRSNGMCLTPDKYGVSDKGLWIRGLFRKAGQEG